MPEPIRTWNGPEWEVYVLQLLRRHYSPGELFVVPDRDRGDCGIEAYCRDGCAYQCYAAEEPLTINQLYEKQRDKITRDLGKFIKNSDRIAPILGSVSISSWVLVVPRHDSARTLAHAQAKAQEVRAAGLPYVADDFMANVTTDDHFDAERAAVLSAGLAQIHMGGIDIDESSIGEWSSGNDVLVQNLDGKIGRLPTLSTTVDRLKFRTNMIRHFMAGQNILGRLHTDHPDLHEQVIGRKAERERFIETESLMTSAGDNMLKAAVSSLRNYLRTQVRGLSDHTIELLVWGAVADWLLRCPLDFPRTEHE